MTTGATLMTDGTLERQWRIEKTPYKLVTTDIESVTDTSITTYTSKFFGHTKYKLSSQHLSPAYNDAPTAGNGDDGTQLNTYGN